MFVSQSARHYTAFQPPHQLQLLCMCTAQLPVDSVSRYVLSATSGIASVLCAGVLLGAGSFARVYKGKWSGLDVAVKVGPATPQTPNTMAHRFEEH